MGTMTKKQIKKLKNEIISESALEVGYATAVINKIPVYALIEAVKNISEFISVNTSDINIQNRLVTESVKVMNYQDFKEIKDYFFHSYK